MKQIHVKLSETLHRQLRIQAAIKGQTLQEYVVDAIERQIAIEPANVSSPRAAGKESGGGEHTR